MINIAWDQALIVEWGRHAVSCGLYREDGIARGFFLDHPERIFAMAYIPGVAWAFQDARNHYQGFTRPDLRRRGICGMLCVELNRELFTPISDRRHLRSIGLGPVR